MRKLFTIVVILMIAIFTQAQDIKKGTYACCRNSFMLTINGSNYKLVRNSFGIDDRNVSTTTIKGLVIKTDDGYTLTPKSYLTTKTLYSKKYKKKIPMKFTTPVSYKSNINLVFENENLYWVDGKNKQQLYLQQ